MNSTVDRFATTRLLGARLQSSDLEVCRRLFQDPSVMATLGGQLLNEQEIQTNIQCGLTHWSTFGFGVWILRDRATMQLIGRVGLRHVTIETFDQVELLYTLLPEFWNRGLATEAAQAAVHHAFQTVRIPRLVSFTLTTNIASRRVMEKCGFQYNRDLVYAGLPHVIYSLNADCAPGV